MTSGVLAQRARDRVAECVSAADLQCAHVIAHGSRSRAVPTGQRELPGAADSCRSPPECDPLCQNKFGTSSGSEGLVPRAARCARARPVREPAAAPIPMIGNPFRANTRDRVRVPVEPSIGVRAVESDVCDGPTRLPSWE